MTKKELLKMLENINEDAELLFVKKGTDRDGYPEDVKTDIYKVLDKNTAKAVRMEYGILRYV